MTVSRAPVGRARGYLSFLLPLLLCAAIFAAYPLRARLEVGEWTFPLDDPWIHQVLARNLAGSHTYGFNPGEPGTASSAPLWTALLVPPHLLGWNPVLWAILLGLLSLAGLGGIVWRWAYVRYGSSSRAAALTAVLLLSPQVAWAGVEGMETALAAGLATLILWRLSRPWERMRDALADGALLGTLLWLRPEALLLAAVVLWERRREPLPRRTGWLVAVGAFAGPYVGFHLWLGGKILPQSVFAKAAYYARPLALDSLGDFLRGLGLSFSPGVWPLVGLLLLVGGVSMARRRDGTWLPTLLWTGLTLLVAALRMPVVLHFGRHFVPLLPALLLASAEGFRALPRRLRWVAGVVGAVLLVEGFALGSAFYSAGCRMMEESQVAMGHYIREHVPPGRLVATHDVGAIGYFSDHPVVDTLALVTPELTSAVARRDENAVWEYLQERGVHYLAALDGMHAALCRHPGVREIARCGRMVLYLLP
ncbi:MAG: hypothetical protein ACP5SI_04020 [Chloroflexia bacterium]